MDDLRDYAVLFVDIAGSTELRRTLGEAQASRRLGSLLEALFAQVATHCGEVMKSDGDDVIAIFSRDGHAAGDAAGAAIAAQQTAHDAGLAIYAGIHAGPLHFLNVLGRRDVEGLAVNYAARLHKLTPGVPGSIFLVRETVDALPPDLQQKTRIYGERVLKGLGRAEVHTLDWREQLTMIPTRYATAQIQSEAGLVLKIAGASLRLAAGDSPLLLGRSKSQCQLTVDDPGALPLVSSRHAQVLHKHGQWWLNDFSRNGTWLRDEVIGDERQVLGGEATLPRVGALCLGRAFAADREGAFTVHFFTDEK